MDSDLALLISALTDAHGRSTSALARALARHDRHESGDSMYYAGRRDAFDEALSLICAYGERLVSQIQACQTD